MAEEIERIYVIPLKKTGFRASRSAPTAVKRVKSYLTKHMKVEEKNIWIDDSLNEALWAHGKYKMPSKIRVKAVKFEDNVVEAYLPELEFKKSRREILKEEREKKAPILKSEEIEPEGEEGETSGTEDYEMIPAADGEMKLKKKKAPKEDKEKEEPKKKQTSKKKPEGKSTKKPEKKQKDKKETKPKKAKKPKEKTEPKTKAKAAKKDEKKSE